MTDKPKRGRFKFHLSTALVLVLILGLFVKINFTIRLSKQAGLNNRAIVRGWPMASVKYFEYSHADAVEWAGGDFKVSQSPQLDLDEANWVDADFSGLTEKPERSILGTVIDIAVALVAIIGIGGLLELLNRRREKARTSERIPSSL